MFASLPFILLLILQGFARQDCAELLGGTHDLASMPVQARSLKSFDDLFATLSFAASEMPHAATRSQETKSEAQTRFSKIDVGIESRVEKGYLEIQRSRDGPVG